MKEDESLLPSRAELETGEVRGGRGAGRGERLLVCRLNLRFKVCASLLFFPSRPLAASYAEP